mgnify:FL=1
MASLQLPLDIDKEGLARNADLKASITSFLRLLVTTPYGDCVADGEFGFLFNNLMLENFNEDSGVVSGRTGAYGKKISGTSRNLNTFASELQERIIRYETRLSDVSVSMSYYREERNIYVTVDARIAGTDEEYRYNTTIKVWN